MEIKINVKEEHIINGVCKNVDTCAIALAVNDVMTNVRIGKHTLCDSNDETITLLPEIAINNIEMFDQCSSIYGDYRLEFVQPFSFEIYIPDNKLSKIFPTSHIKEVEDLIRNSKNCELA